MNTKQAEIAMISESQRIKENVVRDHLVDAQCHKPRSCFELG
jgi:uncharacterized protein YpbB